MANKTLHWDSGQKAALARESRRYNGIIKISCYWKPPMVKMSKSTLFYTIEIVSAFIALIGYFLNSNLLMIFGGVVIFVAGIFVKGFIICESSKNDKP